MSNRILSYGGLLADGGQNTILLSTKKGEVGYRITKFQLMPNIPGLASAEHVIKVFKIEQTTVDGIVDFNDNTLLAAGYTNNYTDAMAYPLQQYTIFNKEIFNQDIYVTHKDVATGQACNYYIELEVIKLDESQAMVTTLQDIRNTS